jgi:hypothetical protein
VPFLLFSAHAAAPRVVRAKLPAGAHPRYWNHPPALWVGVPPRLGLASASWKAIAALATAMSPRRRGSTLLLLAAYAYAAPLPAWAATAARPPAPGQTKLLRPWGDRLASPQGVLSPDGSDPAGLTPVAGFMVLLAGPPTPFLPCCPPSRASLRSASGTTLFALRRFVCHSALPAALAALPWCGSREAPRRRLAGASVPRTFALDPPARFTDWHGSVDFVRDLARRFSKTRSSSSEEHPSPVLPVGLHGANALEFAR